MALSKTKNFKNFISFYSLTKTTQYKLDLFFCFSYTDDKFICYVLLMLITFYNFTVNINIYQNLPIQCQLLKQRIVKSAFCVVDSIFSSLPPIRGASSGEQLHGSVFILSQNLQFLQVHHVVLPNLVSFSLEPSFSETLPFFFFILSISSCEYSDSLL